MKLVLSIDGGGSRGIFPAVILDKIKKSFGMDKFDLIVGNSVGGLLATYLAQKSENDLSSFFSPKNLKTIFDKSYWDKITEIQFKPKYDGKGKRKIIENNITAKKFKDLPIKTVMLAYDISEQHSKIFRSWDEKDGELNPVDICDATSAAPVYFPSVKIGRKYYIDGGVIANNPALVAYKEARDLFGKDADIRIISIGCGYKDMDLDCERTQHYGVQWVYKGLLEILMDAPLDFMNDYCRDLLGDKYLRINVEINKAEMDNISDSYRLYLTGEGEKAFEGNKEKIKRIIECK